MRLINFSKGYIAIFIISAALTACSKKNDASPAASTTKNLRKVISQRKQYVWIDDFKYKNSLGKVQAHVVMGVEATINVNDDGTETVAVVRDASSKNRSAIFYKRDDPNNFGSSTYYAVPFFAVACRSAATFNRIVHSNAITYSVENVEYNELNVTDGSTFKEMPNTRGIFENQYKSVKYKKGKVSFYRNGQGKIEYRWGN